MIKNDNSIIIDIHERVRGKRLKDFIESKIEYSKQDEQKYLKRDGNKIPISEVKIAKLDIGDVVYNDVCFEYKTLADFRNSIKDNRVFQQCVDMNKTFEYPYLIIQGDKNTIFSDETIENYIMREVEYKQYEGAICNIGNAIPIFQPLTEEIAFDMIVKTIVEHQTGHGMTNAYRNKTYNRALCVVHEATDLSWTQCKKLIKEYNIAYLPQLLKLEPKDFEKIKGIGKTKAKKAYDLIQGNLRLNS